MARAGKMTEEITGFHIGGIMPLEQVGFAMRDFVLRGGTLDTIQPFAVKVPVNQPPELQNTNGVSGYLPAPASPQKPLDKAGQKRHRLVLAYLEKFAPREVKAGDIQTAMGKKKMSPYHVRKTLEELQQLGSAKPGAFGHWLFVSGGKTAETAAAEVVASVAPANGADTTHMTKEKTILAFIQAADDAGQNGVSRKDIIAHLPTKGFTGEHWDHGPIIKLLEKKLIFPTGGKGRWTTKKPSKSASK